MNIIGHTDDKIAVRSLIRKGADHPVYCEDSASFFIDENIAVLAVFDGCSSAYRSHFASELLAKCLTRSINTTALCRICRYDEDTLDEILKRLLADTFSLLEETSALLGLRELSIASTAVIAVVGLNTKKVSLAFCGDGVVYVNGNVIRNEQNNIPDYMAYHIHNMHADEYVNSDHVVYHRFENVNDISVCTDGMDSFNDTNDMLQPNIHEDLVKSDRFLKHDVMLERLYNVLKVKKSDIGHYDDLGIVRLIFKTENND